MISHQQLMISGQTSQQVAKNQLRSSTIHGMRLAATKPSCFFHAPKPPAHPCSSSSGARSRPWPWRASAASDGSAETDDGDENEGLQLESTGARGGARISRRKARLSARRRESIRLEDGVDGGGIGEFLRHPAGVESLLNTRALQSFAPVESEPGTFRCTLQRIGFLGFQVAPVLDLRVTPTGAGCAVEMLSCRFEGSDSVEQQNELFSAFMRNQITWGYDGEEPCLDIDVNLEVTLEVYTKPFSLLPLSAVEKPGNLLMQSLLDRLVPMLGEQLLRDYHSWVQQQQPEDSS